MRLGRGLPVLAPWSGRDAKIDVERVRCAFQTHCNIQHAQCYVKGRAYVYGFRADDHGSSHGAALKRSQTWNRLLVPHLRRLRRTLQVPFSSHAARIAATGYLRSPKRAEKKDLVERRRFLRSFDASTLSFAAAQVDCDNQFAQSLRQRLAPILAFSLTAVWLSFSVSCFGGSDRQSYHPWSDMILPYVTYDLRMFSQHAAESTP
jgi:hypothetical protein